MDFSVQHIGVHVRPELIAQVVARIDDKPIRVSLKRDAIEQLVGPAIGDEGAMVVSLYGKLDTLRVAIEAHVFAHGVPLDRQLVLSWRDFNP